jgi:hypothetical protein
MEEFNARLTVLEEKVSSQLTDLKGMMLQVISSLQYQSHRLTFLEHEVTGIKQEMNGLKQEVNDNISGIRREMTTFKQDIVEQMNSQGQDIKTLMVFQQRIMQKIHLEYE